MVKKRFIAGAVCPHCKKLDTICLLILEDDERIECANCDYTESKSQLQPAKPQQPKEQTINWFSSKVKPKADNK